MGAQRARPRLARRARLRPTCHRSGVWAGWAGHSGEERSGAGRAERTGAGRGRRGGEKSRRPGGAEGGEQQAGCTGVWGAEWRRDSGEQLSTAAAAAGIWAAVRPGRPVSVGGRLPGRLARPGLCPGAEAAAEPEAPLRRAGPAGPGAE